MKRTIQAMIIVMLILAASVAAAATATVAVSARVVGTCKFNTASTNLAFGDLPYDASGNPAGATATASLDFWCTNGATYAITDDMGLHETAPGGIRQMQSTTLATPEYIAYGLTYNPASGTGLGPSSPITLTVDGTVGATYGSNSFDTFNDTVTLTITP